MELQKAAANLRLLVERHYLAWGKTFPTVQRCEDGRGVSHALWMLDQIGKGEIVGKKGHRWLGDAAGMLRQLEIVDLAGCKYANLFS